MSTVPSRIRRAAVATASAAALAVALLPSSDAGAAGASTPTALAKKLVSPLSTAVNEDNVLYYSDNFAGTLHRMAPGKPSKVVYRSRTNPPSEVGAVSTLKGVTYFVHGANLMKRGAGGKVTRVANLGAFEEAENPDSAQEYGIPDLPQECIDQWPTGEGVPPHSYTGIVEAHPYGTAAAAGGVVYVADAAGNTILRVQGGEISTVAVLEPVPVEVSAEMAGQFQLPDCVVGETYLFEGVPTDVEIGPDGLLYVSGLPGGEVPGKGSVMTVDPETGATTTLAEGLTSATGLAVTPTGVVYVSQLFANQITMIAPGQQPTRFASAPFPSAVEVKGRKLYATVNSMSGLMGPGAPINGKLVRYTR